MKAKPCFEEMGTGPGAIADLPSPCQRSGGRLTLLFPQSVSETWLTRPSLGRFFLSMFCVLLFSFTVLRLCFLLWFSTLSLFRFPRSHLPSETGRCNTGAASGAMSSLHGCRGLSSFESQQLDETCSGQVCHVIHKRIFLSRPVRPGSSTETPVGGTLWCFSGMFTCSHLILGIVSAHQSRRKLSTEASRSRAPSGYGSSTSTWPTWRLGGLEPSKVWGFDKRPDIIDIGIHGGYRKKVFRGEHVDV